MYLYQKVCVYVYVCVCIYMYTCVNVYIHTYIYTCINNHQLWLFKIGKTCKHCIVVFSCYYLVNNCKAPEHTVYHCIRYNLMETVLFFIEVISYLFLCQCPPLYFNILLMCLNKPVLIFYLSFVFGIHWLFSVKLNMSEIK